MIDKIVYWATVLDSFLGLALLVANLSLIGGNQRLQAEAAQRQAVIATATNLTPLNQNLAQALAEVSVKYDDGDIRDLLATQGISIRKPEAAKGAEGADAAKKKKPSGGTP